MDGGVFYPVGLLLVGKGGVQVVLVFGSGLEGIDGKDG
jgi:hypothetical protein